MESYGNWEKDRNQGHFRDLRNISKKQINHLLSGVIHPEPYCWRANELQVFMLSLHYFLQIQMQGHENFHWQSSGACQSMQFMYFSLEDREGKVS
jgi:hypothetical protein